MSGDTNLTIGDVLPSMIKSQCSDAVLATTVKDAIDIVRNDASSSLSDEDVSTLKAMAADYDKFHAYWKKADIEYAAYW